MWAVARRPRWIALLLLALVLAGTFAGLGKWQLERSIANGKPLPATTETRKALDDVTEPGRAASESIAGQRITVTGRFVAGDTTILTGRSGGGTYQAIGHLVDTETGASLPVVIGWSDERRQAEAGGERLTDGEPRAPQGSDSNEKHPVFQFARNHSQLSCRWCGPWGRNLHARRPVASWRDLVRRGKARDGTRDPKVPHVSLRDVNRTREPHPRIGGCSIEWSGPSRLNRRASVGWTRRHPCD